ncbi:MAG: hypothetical protein ACI8V4_003758 [Ilumatobacter sp.]|jgi:hypothetical protein
MAARIGIEDLTGNEEILMDIVARRLSGLTGPLVRHEKGPTYRE